MARGGDGVLVSFQAATTSAPPAGSTTAIRVRPASSGDVVPRSRSPVGDGGDHAGWWRRREARTGSRVAAGPRPRGWRRCPTSCRPTAAEQDLALRRVRPSQVWSTNRTCSASRPSPGGWPTAPGCCRGPSGSGRTTALRAVVHAAAAVLEPAALHVHVIDARGGACRPGRPSARRHPRSPGRPTRLRRARPAPARRGRPSPRRACPGTAPPARARRRRRRALPPAHRSPWSSSTAGTTSSRPSPRTRPTSCPVSCCGCCATGGRWGWSASSSGGRSLLHPRWGAVAARTFLLGPVDPLDAALAGLRATDLPRDPPPGRAVRVHDRREVQFVAASARRHGAARGPLPTPTGGRRRLATAAPAVGDPTARRRAPGQLSASMSAQTTPHDRAPSWSASEAPPAHRGTGGRPTTGGGCSSPGPRAPAARTCFECLPSPSAPQADSLPSSNPDRSPSGTQSVAGGRRS